MKGSQNFTAMQDTTLAYKMLGSIAEDTIY